MALRACVINLGCKVNRVESDTLESAFVAAGAQLSRAEEADVIVINTCAVTGEAEAKARKAIRRAAGMSHHPMVAVCGCMASLVPDEVGALADNVRVFADKRTLVADVMADLDLPEANNAKGIGSLHGAFHSRRGVKVQDGCDNRCTYCIVWKARGPVRSESLDIIEDQVRHVLAEGADEVVLTGINLGRFCAQDGDGKPVDLAGLLDRICALGPSSVRISSVEPPDLTSAVIDAMARHPEQVAAHLHLPLQSGSDTVLARMGRHYSTNDYAKTVAMIRERLPHISLTTDIIVGFPGETDEEFAETMAFVRAMGFSKIHVFRYSARPGTPAAGMADQITPSVSKARSEQLRARSAELRLADAQARIGTHENVLIESIDAEGNAHGTTASYHDIMLPAGRLCPDHTGMYRCIITDVDVQHNDQGQLTNVTCIGSVE